ncbi:MAG: HAD-IIA family hydrolase [Candidatus Nanohaloarchaeota archaeon QJJ-9]|nr:HAD-IIA family hydrolase [Candidatus Nanohaloarchaeota archaeon QJJ-9]
MPKYKRDLKEIDNFVFDLDWTVWHWNKLAPGVKDTIRELKSKGKNIYYITNNSLLSRKGFADKLSNLGINTEKEDVVCSPHVAAEVFADNDISKAYVIGEEPLINVLESEDIKTSKNAEHVLIGADRNFNYWKLAKAAELVRDGSKLWTLGAGTNFKAGDRVLPGDMPIINAVKTAAKVDSHEMLGKPSEYMKKIVEDEFSLRPGKTIVIGDHIETDIAFGNKLGAKTGLVLGGESSRSDLKDIDEKNAPDFVFKKFERILMKV